MSKISKEALAALEARIAGLTLDIPELEAAAQKEGLAARAPRVVKLKLPSGDAALSGEGLAALESRLAELSLEIPALEAVAREEGLSAPAPRAIKIRRGALPRAQPAMPARVEPKPPPSPPPIYEPQPPARSRRFPVPIALAGALLALSVPAARRWYHAVQLRAHQVFPLAFPATTSLTGDGQALYTVDPERGLFYELSAATLETKRVLKLPVDAIDGLALSGNELWSAEARSGTIRKHALDADLTVKQTYVNAESRPSAVYWDGKYLWTADRRTETIYQYAAGKSLKPVNQYSLPGVVPAGLHVSNDRLTVLDAATRRLYRYKLGGMLAGEDYIDLSAWLDGRPTGFTLQGDILWVAAQSPSEIHRFDLTLLSKIPNVVRPLPRFGPASSN